MRLSLDEQVHHFLNFKRKIPLMNNPLSNAKVKRCKRNICDSLFTQIPIKFAAEAGK